MQFLKYKISEYHYILYTFYMNLRKRKKYAKKKKKKN